MRQETKNKSQT